MSGGIKLRVSASGFRDWAEPIRQVHIDSSTNALFFDQTQVAFLQPGSLSQALTSALSRAAAV